MKDVTAYALLKKVIGEKWNLDIINLLYAVKKSNFSYLLKVMKPISPNVLNQKLQSLSKYHVVVKTIIRHDYPQEVEYKLTRLGELCLEILRPAMLSAEKEILRYFKDVDNNLDEEIKAELFTSYICDDNNQIDN